MNETKVKLDQKIVSLKTKNKEQNETIRNSAIKNERPRSNYMGNPSQGNLSARNFKPHSAKKLVLKPNLSQNVFLNSTRKSRPYGNSQVVMKKKVFRQYKSHTPLMTGQFTGEMQRRYPQAPKHAAKAPNKGFFYRGQEQMGGRSQGARPNKSDFVYLSNREQMMEESANQPEMMVQEEEEEEENLEKYVPVYMIGDQYIPVEEYERMKRMGEIEDDSEEDGEEEMEEGEMEEGEMEEGEMEEGEEDEEMEEDDEEMDEEAIINYQNGVENYPQEEEYYVNGYEEEEQKQNEEMEEEGEDEMMHEDDDEENMHVEHGMYQQIIENQRKVQ